MCYLTPRKEGITYNSYTAQTNWKNISVRKKKNHFSLPTVFGNTRQFYLNEDLNSHEKV